MRYWSVIAVVAVGIVIGCGSGTSGPMKPVPGEPTRSAIGVSVLTLGNPFFKTIGDTITAEAGKHGFEVIVVDGANDVARQQNQVKDFLVRKAAAIVLCPCDSKAIGPAIREANAAGVPVFTADIACLATDAKVVCHVATDNYEGGKQAALAMIEALGPSGGKVVILDFKQVESCILRVKGFKEVIVSHNLTATGKIMIAAELPGDGAKDKGYKAAEDSLQAHPDLKGIFAINDPSALGARAALEKAGKADSVKLVGFDGQIDGKQAIKEGKIYADPIQFPDEIGRKTVEAILQYLDGRPPPAQVLIPTKLYRKADALADPALKMSTLVEMRSIAKSYPGVRALAGVDFDVRAGEVVALVGENGAGKSTLVKVLGGAVTPDAGEIRIDGRLVSLSTPADARRVGVAVIHQEFALVPGLTAAENVFLGRETTRWGFVRRGDERRRAAALFEQIGIPVDPDSRCRHLSVAQQQAVEIAKALAADARVLVMDEPTATLTPPEVAKLFAVVRGLTVRGIGVVFIGHRLDEVFAVADRVVVLRDGGLVASGPVGEFERGRLIALMVGRRLDQEFPKRTTSIGEPRLVVRDFVRGDAVRGVSFSIRRGEVLGLAGLVGAGRTEVARLLFGADARDAGAIELDGRRLDIRSPRHAIRAGIGLLTEDRKGQGLVLAHPVRENFALPNLAAFTRFGFLSRRREATAYAARSSTLRIRTPSRDTPARNLSGGNQQKIVLAKWLERNCEVLIFDEPTRGIDVGAKYEIYLLINELAAAGKVVLFISSELPEVLGMCDRVLVMHAGKVRGEIADPAVATQEDVLRLAVGEG